MVSIPEEISRIYVDVVSQTMQRILRNGGADNYSMDSLTLSMKHLSPICAVPVCMCAGVLSKCPVVFANKVCKQFEGAIILKHYPVLMSYSILMAQIENPITAPWQRSQLCNFIGLCFLCATTWKSQCFALNYQARQLSNLCSNKTSISLENAATFYQVCLFPPTDVTNRIGQ